MLIISLVLTVLMSGCVGGGRSFFSSGRQGEDVGLAIEAGEAAIVAKQARENAEAVGIIGERIEEDAAEILGRTAEVDKIVRKGAPGIVAQTSEHTDAIIGKSSGIIEDARLVQDISKDQEAGAKAFTDFSEYAINKSKGKWKMSGVMLILLYLLGFGLAFTMIGMAFQNIPFLQPITRLINSLGSAMVDMASGFWQQKRSLDIQHLDRTSHIQNEEMPVEVQTRIIKERQKGTGVDLD